MSGPSPAYQAFLKRKQVIDAPTGINADNLEFNPLLFDYQRDIVRWALRRGRAALFEDCGLGKTIQELEWARHVPGRVLITAPLGVAVQTVDEAAKFGYENVRYLRADDGKGKIVVTNNEMMRHFSPSEFAGIVIDESSCLKSLDGKFKQFILDEWSGLPFRLEATATPAPNDFMELGNHAEFLGVMSHVEMLAHFFVHDGGETQKWRLKGHAEEEFWRWMASWSVMIRKPSDLGYDDGDFKLPPLHMHQVTVDSNAESEGFLFALEAHTMEERRNARRASVSERVDAVADLANSKDEQWLIWCDLNAESEALAKAIPTAVEIRGSDSIEKKEAAIKWFKLRDDSMTESDWKLLGKSPSSNQKRDLISKPSMFGWGLNFQHCSHAAFTGLSDSFEQLYQAVRRNWRFGQKNPVHCYVITANTEGAVVKNIQRKERDSQRMADMMVKHMADLNSASIRGTARMDKSYTANQTITKPAFL